MSEKRYNIKEMDYVYYEKNFLLKKEKKNEINSIIYQKSKSIHFFWVEFRADFEFSVHFYVLIHVLD